MTTHQTSTLGNTGKPTVTPSSAPRNPARNGPGASSTTPESPSGLSDLRLLVIAGYRDDVPLVGDDYDRILQNHGCPDDRHIVPGGKIDVEAP